MYSTTIMPSPMKSDVEKIRFEFMKSFNTSCIRGQGGNPSVPMNTSTRRVSSACWHFSFVLLGTVGHPQYEEGGAVFMDGPESVIIQFTVRPASCCENILYYCTSPQVAIPIFG